MECSVWISLRSNVGTCSFTILETFADIPVKGDNINIVDLSFVVSNRMYYLDVPITTPKVQYDHPDHPHHTKKPMRMLIVINPHSFADEVSMFKTLDWFKLHYHIVDLQADNAPTPYYSFYRSVLRLLGWGTGEILVGSHQDENSLNLRVLAGAVRSVLIAELINEKSLSMGVAFSNSAEPISAFLKIVMDKRQRSDKNIDTLVCVKEWVTSLTTGISINGEASEEECLEAARFVFKRLSSIPVHMLPRGLNPNPAT